MTLLRAAARTMMASYFVVNGVKEIRDPQSLVADAEPLVDRIVPVVKEYAPDQVSNRVPEDTATLVRVHGALQLVGGLALATGKGRRLGAFLLALALVPATVARHPFWSRTDPEEKARDRASFLKNVSLLGGVLLASRDTEGRPGLAWRAQKGGEAIARSSRRTTKKLAKSGSGLTDEAKELAESAVASGALLLGTVAATGRKARKESAQQFKQAKKVAVKQLGEAREAAATAAKQAQKQNRVLAKQSRKEGEKRRAKAEKAARKRSKNIQLGEN